MDFRFTTMSSALRPRSCLALGVILVAVVLGGCSGTPSNAPLAARHEQRTFVLTHLRPKQAQAILAELALDGTVTASEPNVLMVDGEPSEIEKAAVALALVDVNEAFIVMKLAPAARVRSLPGNDQIAQAVGGLTIGTFAEPPPGGQEARAIIDVCGASVVALVPAHLGPQVRAVAEFGPSATRYRAPAVKDPNPQDHGPAPATLGGGPVESPPVPIANLAAVIEIPALSIPEDKLTSAQPSQAGERPPEPNITPELSRGVLRPSAKNEKPTTASSPRSDVSFLNADDVLELSLPEKIELVQLLDLAGEYLHLDCMYDAEKIGNPMITLKLHSKLRTEMRVKDLYGLLETVLKFRGLAMSRRQGNLVTIVPAAEALEIDPQLVDPNSGALQAGDIVVTRVFELQHVDAASVSNLLQSMKLSVAVSPIPDTQTLFVTCYAHRMARIEQLVDLVDRPGKPREFRFRQMRYTLAATLARKVLALAQELEGITISIGATQADSAGNPPRAPRVPQNPTEARAPLSGSSAVYLDTDERTNRMLMIGPVEQLETVEGLIDALDVPQQDLRTLKVYRIEHVDAAAVLEKLQQLKLIDSGTGNGPKAPRPGTATEDAPAEQPQVVLLEATNCLLVNATIPQHAQMRTVIGYIDVLAQDARVMKIYNIRHVAAEEVASKLQQLQLAGPVAVSAGRSAKASQPASAAPAAMVSTKDAALPDSPQVVVLETTNALLIHAKALQHERIQRIIEQIDTEALKQTVPYEVYFLENQDPEQLAQVLNKLIQETVLNPEGKIEKTVSHTEEAMTIIPDKNTFSLIVHASRKNQDWIAGLVEKLDRRRPQVLIDVTLVEITETETFNYDLNLIASAPDLTQTSGLTGTIVGGPNPVTSTDIMDKLAASDRSQFADFQSDSGDLTAFYGDKHINLLLRAMQTKNYGRILAKPKILVNDNEPGSIKTTDTTYVVKTSSIPVGSGAAGNDVKLIETSTNYEPYEAGITLDITPHTSQGDILRLDIQLTRSDFRETENEEKPPDTTASELKTTVFAPDGSTIILGGLLKLNQNKGGAKVPILGDIPFIGGLFRSINNRDSQSKLYIFVKSEIIRPAGLLARGADQLQAASARNRQAFEKHEQEFQEYQSWPGIKSKPVEPAKVLEAR